MKSLLTPGICLVAVAALLHTGVVTPSPLLIAYAFYGVLIAGLLLAWRFHSSRIFLALLGKRLGAAPAGWEQAAGLYGEPGFFSVADVDGPEALAKVREYKREKKAAAKAKAAESFDEAAHRGELWLARTLDARDILLRHTERCLRLSDRLAPG